MDDGFWERGPGTKAPAPSPKPTPQSHKIWWHRLPSLCTCRVHPSAPIIKGWRCVERTPQLGNESHGRNDSYENLRQISGYGPILPVLVFGAAPAAAGEAGKISCSTPDCGYQDNLKIGGGMKSPAVTGYCRSTKQFVRLKLKSQEDYRKTHYCPDCPEAILPIYDGCQVAEIPCPQCGNLTLHYKRRLMFD